jgi:hypothetical protein
VISAIAVSDSREQNYTVALAVAPKYSRRVIVVALWTIACGPSYLDGRPRFRIETTTGRLPR